MLADLYRDRAIVIVVQAAGIDTLSIDLSGAPLDGWMRLVTALKSSQMLPKFVSHASREFPRAKSRISLAFEREFDDGVVFENWKISLGREEQRKQARSTIEQDECAPVVALMIAGGPGQGHQHFAAWVRTLRKDRRRMVSIQWSDQVDYVACAAVMVQRLYSAFKIESCAAPPESRPVRGEPPWSTWAPPFAKALLKAWVLDEQSGSTARTMVFVRHTFTKIHGGYADAIALYLNLVWDPIARELKSRQQRGVRIVVAFEIVRDDAMLNELRHIPAKVSSELEIPELGVLTNLKVDEIASWLQDYHEPSQNRAAAGQDADPVPMAKAVHTQTDGVYEPVIDYFGRQD